MHKFLLYVPHFLTDLGEIRHRISLIVESKYCGLYNVGEVKDICYTVGAFLRDCKDIQVAKEDY